MLSGSRRSSWVDGFRARRKLKGRIRVKSHACHMRASAQDFDVLMPDLPSGTVTLLFTDVVGSTQLLKALGDDYESVLSDHRSLLRRAFNLHGGQVVDRQGDSFFVAFRRAKDAVASAVEAQRALASHPWPDGRRLRVRIGIDTGEPSHGEEGLTGLAIHRAARICSAAGGGQILISSTTRQLLEGDLPTGATLRDLGDRELKDFDQPERLFQIGAEGLEDSSPPPGPTDAEVEAQLREAKDLAPTVPSQRLKPKLLRALTDRHLIGSRRPAAGRPSGAHAIPHIGSSIYSMARLSPSPELGRALQQLGGALAQMGRRDSDAEHYSSSAARRSSRRRLKTLRNSAFLSERDARVADALAKKVDALESLAKLRPALRTEVGRIEARTNEIRQEIFRARLSERMATCSRRSAPMGCGQTSPSS
jgi:class 3 adenylate cyclase